VLAAGHEQRQAEPLLAAIAPHRRINLVGKLDLLTAAAMLRCCALFIGNDTGLMHMAAAVGTPTLGLFGPSPSSQYAPWGKHTALVRSVDPPEVMFGPGFDHRTTDTLMDGPRSTPKHGACRLWCAVESVAGNGPSADRLTSRCPTRKRQLPIASPGSPGRRNRRRADRRRDRSREIAEGL
jgi:hypothetical protein